MKTVLLLCGGTSQEHEISLISAKCILDALDRNQYTPIVVGIHKNGVWQLQNDRDFYDGEFRADKIRLKDTQEHVTIAPYLQPNGRARLLAEGRILEFDVVFPILHGTHGEDGSLQGMLDIIGVPYVGSGCESSAVCMDKVLTKACCERLGIPVAPYVVVQNPNDVPDVSRLTLPLFVKPARQGSSVGVTRVTDLKQLSAAITEAFHFDNKVLIEQGILGREIECAILGDKASLPGEIVVSPEVGWYSYEAKYLSSTAARTEVPAQMTSEMTRAVQELCLNAFRGLECKGLARVDLLVEKSTNKIYLNEVNTLPGFTPISMYPQMWQKSGVSYPELISRLLELA